MAEVRGGTNGYGPRLGDGGQAAYGSCSLIRCSASSASQAVATVGLELRGLAVGVNYNCSDGNTPIIRLQSAGKTSGFRASIHYKLIGEISVHWYTVLGTFVLPPRNE